MNVFLKLKLGGLASAILATSLGASADVAGCKLGDFVLGSEITEIRIVEKSFSPKCLRVKTGSSVVIDATARHPLKAMPDIDGKRNPYAGATHVSPQQRVLTEPGIYGFYCDSHGDEEGDGMAGAIVVE